MTLPFFLVTVIHSSLPFFLFLPSPPLPPLLSPSLPSLLSLPRTHYFSPPFTHSPTYIYIPFSPSHLLDPPYTVASFGLETAPLSQAVQTNSSVHLTCGPRTHAHISWVKGRPEDGIHSLPSDERVNATGGELDIVHFHARDHEGLYFCVANDTNGLFRSCPARITHASECG